MFRIFYWVKSTQKMKRNFQKNCQKFWIKFTAFGRKIFELSKIKEIFGGIFLVLLLTTNLSPHSVSWYQTLFDTNHTKLQTTGTELITKQSLQKPLGIFRITKGYSFFHPAIDLATDAGSAVLPILPGKAERISYSHFGYGNYILINHGSGLKSFYAHLAKINVKEGQKIEKNNVIGLIGSTGWSTGPHLHLEIIENNRKINPLVFFESYFGQKLASSR